jgi:hypothetical protein
MGVGEGVAVAVAVGVAFSSVITGAGKVGVFSAVGVGSVVGVFSAGVVEGLAKVGVGNAAGVAGAQRTRTPKHSQRRITIFFIGCWYGWLMVLYKDNFLWWEMAVIVTLKEGKEVREVKEVESAE